ncbi:MAG TPA: SDR family oxidoreductase [Dehalococcoidia bacterium]|nr:SDR family oxidoreductase [Dehalococcoidia bacterium]
MVSCPDNDIINIGEYLRDIDLAGKTVLVTGGAGFLGSWVCDALMYKGARVLCVDNLSSGAEENIAHLRGKDGFQFIKHDITQPLQPDLKLDLVIHMASRASPFEFERFPEEIIQANTQGTLIALGIAREFGATFLFASSSEVYGDPSLVPTPESFAGNIDPTKMRSCYSVSKRCGEAYVAAFRRQYGLDARVARIFNTYGPRMRADGIYGRAVPRFISQALRGNDITVFGQGRQTRSFCYVTDQVAGLLRLATSPGAEGEVVNIGNDTEITILETAEMIKRLTGSQSQLAFYPLPEDDPIRRCPDIGKARRLLGWEPRVGLEEGLRKTIAWFDGAVQ